MQLYSEPRYIQNSGIFKIWGIFRTLLHIYDEAFINLTAIIIFTNLKSNHKSIVWFPVKELMAVGNE